jgi:hypothetical protein
MYSGTQDCINVLGGTKSISVGSGTCITTTTVIEYFINKADVLIDSNVSNLYGSYAFGTSAYGTKGVPGLITSISADLSAWYLTDSITTPNKSTYFEYGVRLHDRAMELLNQISDGSLVLTGYTKQEGGLPVASDYTFDNSEVITLSGTNLTDLQYEKVIEFSEVVTGTSLDDTTAYVRDVDYKMYYYDNPATLDNAGQIRAIGTNLIDMPVKIRYKVIHDPVFGRNDCRVWGQVDAGFSVPQDEI